MAVDVVPLKPDRIPDFWRIHAPENGEGWCCCVAWWLPTWDGWGERSESQNRELREALFARGELDGYLMYVDGAPSGWCQCGPRDRLAKLVRQHGLEADPDVWAISCFVVIPSARGRGLAHAFLHGILDHLRSRGVRRVQSFPRRGVGLEPGEVWTGPEALYKSAGFAVEREHPDQPVYGITLDARREAAERTNRDAAPRAS